MNDLLSGVLILKSSPWVKPVVRRANDLELRINLSLDLLEELEKCQRSWTYLEVIFNSGDDVKNKLPKETQIFDFINNSWYQYIRSVAQNPSLNDIDFERFKNDMAQNNSKVQQIQKALSEFLDRNS